MAFVPSPLPQMRSETTDHTDALDGLTTPFAKRGNDHADKVAKSAAAAQAPPSAGEFQEHYFQVEFLRQYMRFVPKALALWLAVGPTLGKKSLPRREGAQRG